MNLSIGITVYRPTVYSLRHCVTRRLSFAACDAVKKTEMPKHR